MATSLAVVGAPAEVAACRSNSHRLSAAASIPILFSRRPLTIYVPLARNQMRQRRPRERATRARGAFLCKFFSVHRRAARHWGEEVNCPRTGGLWRSAFREPQFACSALCSGYDNSVAASRRPRRYAAWNNLSPTKAPSSIPPGHAKRALPTCVVNWLSASSLAMFS